MITCLSCKQAHPLLIEHAVTAVYGMISRYRKNRGPDLRDRVAQ